ncbi:hypothetical protein EU528_07420 [Candidatus Thorarchaeota archaeon]|nr:MAG: hypothetical protein EU528_07420 [Candidatus Thorarchaeota archaeon]
MGDSALLKRFHEFCNIYEANRSFEGTVEDFDTIWYVDPERLTRGMTVRTESDTKFVEFHPKRKPAVEIGDHVIVAGLVTVREKNNVNPAVILNSTKRYVLFPQDIRVWSTSTNLLWNLPETIGLALAGIGTWISSSAFLWMIFLGWLIFGGAAFPKYFVKDYLQRSRLYSCDERTWEELTAAISSRFSYLPMV